MSTPAGTSRPLTNRQSPHAQRGFTLMETVLAMVLGSMVLLGAMGVFLAMRNMESTFATRYERTSELDLTHTVITKAMLSLQMEETVTTTVVRASSDAEAQDIEIDDTPDPRARILLETDTSTAPDSTGWTPQRFELVNATPPVPSSLSTQAAGWYVAQSLSDDSLDFSAMDGSQGIVRGVFELRPTGQREIIMNRLGLISTTNPILEQTIQADITLDVAHETPNWTLWWRPILSFEGEQLLYGQSPSPDTIGTPDEIRARLAGAVPLLRNIERCTWELFKGDEFVGLHTGHDMSDLPAYAQFEVILTNSQYASWMFEIDWVIGTDPSTDDTGDDDDSETDDPNGSDDDGGQSRPAGNTGSNPTRVIDLGGS